MSKKVSIDINWASEIRDLDKQLSKEYGIKIEDKGRMNAIVTGDPKKIKTFLLGPDYDMDLEDIIDLYPELSESTFRVKTFSEYINEANDYDSASKFHSDVASKELNVPKGIKKGDIIAFSKTKNWEADLAKLEKGTVAVKILIVKDPAKQDFYIPMPGRKLLANNPDLKIYDFSTVLSIEDIRKLSDRAANDIEEFKKENNI